MCGIIGYIGGTQAMPILIEGLKRLEYRGYDSAGVAIFENGSLLVEKTKGKISQLERLVNHRTWLGSTGMAHTRWATHGEPNTENAHPTPTAPVTSRSFTTASSRNYSKLKQVLIKEGHTFTTETDTEVIAHLVEKFYKQGASLEEAVQKTVSQLEGTYGLVIMCKREPDKIIGVRNGSPLIVGVASGRELSALRRVRHSETHAEGGLSRRHEMATVYRDKFVTKTVDNVTTSKEVHEVDWDLEQIEKGGFDHFMLKEINEQPETITNAMRGRLVYEEGIAKLGGLNMTDDELRSIKRIMILGCGTSWHAG
jgi:glucosamine--fructose-6-phosphate aminotransferase (isomerizing)